MLRELEKALPENAMVSTDIGNICSVSNSYLRFQKPNSFFAAMSFGNCGYAFPTIIGTKVAAPDRPAVAYVGDGAWGMSFGEILTCVREDIPVTAVVFHNKQWGAEKKNQVDFYGTRFLGVNLENPSFAEIARRPRSSRSCAPASWATRSAGMRFPSRCACWTSTRTT
jgi:sulfoacetaldehyde acetyltransferase